jgi:hypothetical protein
MKFQQVELGQGHSTNKWAAVNTAVQVAVISDMELHKDGLWGPDCTVVSLKFSDFAEKLNVLVWSLYLGQTESILSAFPENPF